MASSCDQAQARPSERNPRRSRAETSGALQTTRLLEGLVRNILVIRTPDDSSEAAASEARVHGAVRLSVRILTSHIGEPLISGDEASIMQVIRTRLAKAPHPNGSGVDASLRFEDLYRRLRLLAALKNRASILHLLYALADFEGKQRKEGVGVVARVPHVLFSEPEGALPVVEKVKAQSERVGLTGGTVGCPEPGDDEEIPARRQNRASGMSEIMERSLLRGILYAFQGIDSQYIKFNEDESGYTLDVGLRLGIAELALVKGMLEMGWLFTEVAKYVKSVEGRVAARGGPDAGPGVVQQAFVFSLREDLTEYYRLIAVLGAQLNLDAENAGKASRVHDVAASTGTEGLTLRRLAVWVSDPLERLKILATLVTSAGHLKGGPLVSCLHTHVQHGDSLVRGLVQRTMVRVCQPLFAMIRNWVFEGELNDHHREFFVRTNSPATDEMLWQERYSLDPAAVPNFIDKQLATKILTIGKSINFLRRLCDDSEWIMGPMAKAAAQAQTMEYGNTASLRAVVESCSSLTNARLVELILGPYRLWSHLRILKKLLLHGQGDVMLTLVEVLAAELNKRSSLIFGHSLGGVVESVIKTSVMAQENPEDLSRVMVKIKGSSDGDTGWKVFTLSYKVDPPISAIVHSKAIAGYEAVFRLLWRIKRVEWSLASAWRLHNSAMHLRVETTIPALKYALHRCSLVRGQMVFLTTNLSNYMMFEVLETSWGTLEERLGAATTLDDMISAHDSYMADILCRALLEDGQDITAKLTEVLTIIIEFCSHQENLILRAMAEVTTRRSETRAGGKSMERRQSAQESKGGRGTVEGGHDALGLNKIEDVARRYEGALSELVQMLEERSGKTEMLRFLIFRLDFNGYYKERRALPKVLPPPGRKGPDTGNALPPLSSR